MVGQHLVAKDRRRHVATDGVDGQNIFGRTVGGGLYASLIVIGSLRVRGDGSPGSLPAARTS